MIIPEPINDLAKRGVLSEDEAREVVSAFLESAVWRDITVTLTDGAPVLVSASLVAPHQAASQPPPLPEQPAAYSVDETARFLGLSVDLVYTLLRRGESQGGLRSLKVGRRRIIPADSLQRYLSADRPLRPLANQEAGEPIRGPKTSVRGPNRTRDSGGNPAFLQVKGTSSGIQPPGALRLQARGRWFEPACAHKYRLTCGDGRGAREAC